VRRLCRGAVAYAMLAVSLSNPLLAQGLWPPRVDDQALVWSPYRELIVQRSQPNGGSSWWPNAPLQAQPDQAEPSAAGAVFGGILGGVVGGGVGVGLAVALASESGCYEADCLGYLLVPLLLEPVGMALGTHLGNQRRGSFSLDVLLSFLTLGVGFGIDANSDSGAGGPGLALVAVLQLTAVVITERATGRRR